MYWVELADGTRYAADWCGASQGILNVMIAQETTVLVLAQAFSDADATARIIFEHDGTRQDYYGFRHLAGILEQGGNRMLIQLRGV